MLHHSIKALLLTLILSSCSFFVASDDTEVQLEDSEQFVSKSEMTPDHESSSIAVEELPDKSEEKEPEQLDKVEVLWKIPDSPVDGFMLHYGYAREALTRSVKLSTADIEKHQDRQFGNVYRYIIGNLQPNKSVFISLQTIEGDVISEPSEIFEVSPE